MLSWYSLKNVCLLDNWVTNLSKIDCKSDGETRLEGKYPLCR